MTNLKDSKLTGADIRARLNHPVIDADGHMMETTFAVLDFVKQVGGADIAERYEGYMKANSSANSRPFCPTRFDSTSKPNTK